MAAVSPVTEIEEYPEVNIRPEKVVVPPSPVVRDDVVHVAVGKVVKESELTLCWALHNCGGRRICIMHVHQPAQKIPFMGPKFPITQLDEHHVNAYHDAERQDMQKVLDKYMLICEQSGIDAEQLTVEMDSIEKGIVELIHQRGIGKLVIGGAANKSYARRMIEPKSKKAIYVRQHAPPFCHIWFVCKGHLIHTRESRMDALNPEVLPLPPALTPSRGTGQLSPSRSISDTGQTDQSVYSTPENSRVSSTHFRWAPSSRSFIDRSIDGRGGMSRTSSSGELQVRPFVLRQELKRLQNGIIGWPSSTEKIWTPMYAEELRKRRETEEALARGGEDVSRMQQHLSEITEDLQVAQEENSSLESQIADSHQKVEELEQKISLAADLIEKFKKERDELEVKRDDALRIAEDLRENKHAERSSSRPNYQFFVEFSFSEIKEATNNFDPALKIGEGGYGIIYKGFLRHTPVAIKMLNSNSSQGPSEFLQEVNTLGKLRHPNIITLIGACPEAWGLVYEYLPNGSLEDRLNPKGNTPPLSWQTRIRVAAELCSVLLFLHSCRPQGIIHGDLKPSNILLDDNYVSKLSDIGIGHVITRDEVSGNEPLVSCGTNATRTFSYVDPEFCVTEELTSKSDVFLFGIILLRLLTGKPAMGITKEVQYALYQGNLKYLLDPAAGDWPFVQAKQLAHLGMSCCCIDGINRPGLACEVKRVLEPMRASCGVSPSWFGSEECSQIPSHFICPIFQETMRHPVVAADGYTYEAEAFKGWLDSGHDTSPMTNSKLEHINLVPNLALCSDIQEWLQQ